MLGGVTRHILPHLPGVPYLHVNRPLIDNRFFFLLNGKNAQMVVQGH